ncbi:MAG: ATP-binding protein [Deltaproteobacteria bacterium]|nr:ATP-binding protein [Deltaproteobacteria bacterium]
MKLTLSKRLNIYIGVILIAGMFAIMLYDQYSETKLLRDIGSREAERLANVVFDQLYTSMRLGGGRNEDRAIIERIRKIEGADEIRIIHGEALDRQYGVEEDELPRDAFEKASLAGDARPVSSFEEAGGFTVARLVLPIAARQECLSCHKAADGVIMGAISIRLPLNKYETLFHLHKRDSLFLGVAILAFVSFAVILTVRRRVVRPIGIIKEAADSLASGDLSRRANISTGDEIEGLGRAFDSMADSILAASSRLNELYQRHSKLVQSAPDAITLKDIQSNRFIEANPAALALTGYEKEELMGMEAEAIYPQGKLPQYSEMFKRWAYDGRGHLYDAFIIRKDSLAVPVEISASMVELDGKEYIQEIWRDISERKGLENRLKRQIYELEETVEDRTKELNESLKKLESAYKRLKDSEQALIQSAKLISLGEMGAGIAHELNSPLAGIMSITEVMLNRLKDDPSNHFLLEKIKDAAVRSKHIILDMLTYARPFKGEYAAVDINEVVDATLSIFISEIRTGAIEVVKDLQTGIPPALGDKGQLIEVMLNIIKNAKDAVQGRGGRIFITTRERKDYGKTFVVAEIKDTGPGIMPEIRDRIFDPFFTTKGKGGGLNIGLGLSIARSIVASHGGNIEVESKANEGSAFRVVLPAEDLPQSSGARQAGKEGGG